MPKVSEFLAIDLGASSGRVMLARLLDDRFELAETHRFANGPAQKNGGFFWDAPCLYEQMKIGIRAAAERGHRPCSLSIDTWGVDFGLLDAAGELIDWPRHYRDPRNEPAMRAVHQRIAKARIYDSTGIQFMALNTLYQLEAISASRFPANVRRLLFMPNLFHYWLTGEEHTEPTIASTSQIMNARTRTWDGELLDAVAVPREIMPAIQPTGTLGAPLHQGAADELGLPELRVVLGAGHDTAAAVAAVPAAGDDWAFISSGTWSLVGVELPQPLINDDSLAANFTNEAGYGGTIRFLSNVAGLWLLQECLRCWTAAGKTCELGPLITQAEVATPHKSLIDPDDPRFASPGDMPERIASACRELGQPVPESEAAMVRCILDSLALRYHQVLSAITRLTGRQINRLHVVGGGSRNELLNRLIAAATDRTVIAGPVEATALGNAGIQAISVGSLANLDALRAAIRISNPLRTFEPPSNPKERDRWSAARLRFRNLTESSR